MILSTTRRVFQDEVMRSPISYPIGPSYKENHSSERFLALFTSDLTSGFVFSQSDESGVSKMIVARPFQELELSDQDWLEPPAICHLSLASDGAKYLKLCRVSASWPAPASFRSEPVERRGRRSRVST
jgi:hypothetical protein